MNAARDYPYFPAWELRCRCAYSSCPRHGMNEQFMNAIINLRQSLNFPFIVSSAFRCPHHNIDVSSTGAAGPHTLGLAMDIRATGNNARIILDAATAFGFEGIGINQHGDRSKRFIHLDMLKRDTGKMVWSY